MAEIALIGLGKRYKTYEAIRELDLEIQDGSFVALVGPSGCGKSTLLRMIAGLEDVTSGEIVIGGRGMNDVPSQKRDIAMVFQSYALYPHMRVRDNIGFSLRLRRRPKPEIERTVRDAAGIVGLLQHLDRMPAALSGGQRQRVAMGRAIARAPSVFLFDEPLSNLDARLRVQMRTEIKELHQRLGTTTVYVTHDQVEAMTMADTIVLMNQGRIEQVGAPLDLYDRPRNRFVAEFIGSPAMNMIEGRIDGDVWRAGGLALPLPEGVPAAPRAAVLGVRPEHVALGDPEAGDFVAEVEVIEPTGAETVVTVGFEGQRVTALSRDRLALRPGDRLGVTFRRDRLRLFDAESGHALGLGDDG